MPNAPEIERVEWRSAAAGELWVDVHGRWPGSPRDRPLALLIGEGAQPAAFQAHQVRWGIEVEVSAQAEGGAGGAPGSDRFQARFAVPVALRRQLGERLALRLGDQEIGLPSAQAVAVSAPAAPPRNVIDPAVLAERRARRAELGEETLAHRAAQAEAQVHDLEAQLGQLEHQLQDALAERDRTGRELAARDRELRVLRQREYSEQQLRVEAEEQRRRLERQARLDLAAARRRLEEAQRRAGELGSELERVRRQAAEAEHSAAGPLLAELRRRQEVHDHVRAELEFLREELTRLRADTEADSRRRAQAEARASELERTLTSLRHEIDGRQQALTEAEETVAALRAQGADLVRRLEDERREHARADEELRAQLEAQSAAVRAASAELRSELERASDELSQRERREAELAELLADFVRTATALRETFEGEMAEVRAELEERVAAERDTYTRALSELEARVEGLRTHLEDAAALSEELALRKRSESQAHQALADAHEELRSLEHAEARHRGELERLRREVARLREAGPPAAAVEPPGEPPPPAPPAARDQAPRSTPSPAPRAPRPEARPARSPAPPAREEPQLLAADLTEAFRRLRERAAEGHRELGEGPQAGPSITQGPAGPAHPPPRERPEARSPAPSEPPAPAPARKPEPPPPTAAPRPAQVAPRPVTRRGAAWLTAAVADLAQADDPRPAARLLTELLPVQAVLIKRSLTYDLELEELEGEEGGRLRVSIGEGRASVRPRPPAGGRAPAAGEEVDFALRGRIADLAPLVGGSAPRRLAGVEVSGRRRRLHHLLRRLRRPVRLLDLARAGATPDPGQVLAALAQGIDPAWVDGHEFAVVYALQRGGDGDEERRFHVEVRPEQPVRVIEGGPDRGGELEVSAALRVPPGTLVTLLAGLPLPNGQRAEVEGDGGKIVLLGEWFDRVQTGS